MGDGRYATSAQGAKADSAYQKPNDGVPLTDLKKTDLDTAYASAAQGAKADAALTKAVADASYATLGSLAANPDQLAVGTITRSTSGAATSFGVVWPDGATGTFTGTESITTPGAIDSYTVTHVLSGVTTTYTQPTLTRDASGAVTARPALVVS